MGLLTPAQRSARNAEIVARGGLDNESLYHEYVDGKHLEQRIVLERWELEKEIARKAANLPSIPQTNGISVENNTKNGAGWPAVLGAMALGAGALGVGYGLNRDPAPIVQPVPIVQPAPVNPGPAEDRDTDTTGEYDIEWDKSK